MKASVTGKKGIQPREFTGAGAPSRAVPGIVPLSGYFFKQGRYFFIGPRRKDGRV